MVMPEYLVQLYQYNYWANQHMLNVAASLTHEQLFLKHNHSWGSVHAVLLHVMFAEWIWLQRWQGTSPSAFPKWDQYPTVSYVHERWKVLEDEMMAYIASLTPQSLQEEIAYTNTTGKKYKLQLWKMMVHVPNHGTHHRGELAAMFAMMGIPHPEEDWVHYFLETSGQR